MNTLDRPIAYTIAPHPFFVGPLEGDPFIVKQSANAWWMDRVKVYALLIAFRYGANIKDACLFAGISTEQWKYFNEVHPDFSTLKDRISAIMMIKAGFVVSKAIDDNNVKLAMWWMSRAEPADWGSANERLFWAKQAALMPIEEREWVIGRYRHNLEVARELIETGRSNIFPINLNTDEWLTESDCQQLKLDLEAFIQQWQERRRERLQEY